MKVHYLTCATSSSVDGKTNQLSLFHVLDEVGAAAFPLRIASFCVASLFEREPGDEPVQGYVMTITLNDALLASFAMQVDFGRARRNRSVNTLQGLAIPGPGLVKIRLVQRAMALAEWQLVALLTGEPVAQPRPEPAKPNEIAQTPVKTGPTVN